MNARYIVLVMGCLCVGEIALGEEPSNKPRPIPMTRLDLKQLIEDVKDRVPRIPLPELTEADAEKLGSQSTSYESRLRYHYLQGIDEGRGNRGVNGGFSRDQDPLMTLDNAFKVELFWIVSRANNCQYCLGHQESKLLGAGLTEDQIAALDGDWSSHEPAKRVAFAFARKFTYEPQALSDADVTSLREFYTELQILEMILSMAGNNSINRWKEGAGIPQNRDEGGYSRMARIGRTGDDSTTTATNLPSGTYLTPTSPEFAKLISRVAPIAHDPSSGQRCSVTVCRRPSLESRQQTEEQLQLAKNRTPRLALESDEKSREIIGENWPQDLELSNCAKLLARFPKSGVSRIRAIRSADEKGNLEPLLKAQLAWVVGRQDRAWYAIGVAQRKLRELSQTDDQIFALDGDWKEFTDREQALFAVARNLAASPVVLTDYEVATAVKLAGPRDVVQTISYTTNLASFNRITESAGLPLDE